MEHSEYKNHFSLKFRLLFTVTVCFSLCVFLIIASAAAMPKFLMKNQYDEFTAAESTNIPKSLNSYLAQIDRYADFVLTKNVLGKYYTNQTRDFIFYTDSPLNIFSQSDIGGVIVSTEDADGYFGFIPNSVTLPTTSALQKALRNNYYLDTNQVYADNKCNKYILYLRSGIVSEKSCTVAVYIKTKSFYNAAAGKNNDFVSYYLLSSDNIILTCNNNSLIGNRYFPVDSGRHFGRKSEDIFSSPLSFAINGASLSVQTDSAVIGDKIEIDGFIILYCIIILVCVLLILSGILSAKVTNPMHKVIDSLSAFNGTDRATINLGRSGNEIAELEESYNNMVKRINKLMAQTKEDAGKQRALELTALQEQINPHFLYNTLDTIAWLSKIKKQPEIEKLVVSLARFFRISLHKGDKYITVSEEIELVKNFVNIQQIRFPEKVDISYNISKNVSKQKMLKILLQPFVENCLKHGFGGDSTNHKIVINGFHLGSDIIFEIIDNGVGFDVPDNFINRRRVHDDSLNGYGINNVEERIKLEYGNDYGITVKSRPGEGTKVTVRICDLPNEN